jgi:hypothetical protein
MGVLTEILGWMTVVVFVAYVLFSSGKKPKTPGRREVRRTIVNQASKADHEHRGS